MTKIENEAQYLWAEQRVEKLLPLVNDHTPTDDPSMYEMGLTQANLGKILNISASRVSEILSGKCEPTLKVARSICTNLNIDANIVLGV